MTSTAATRTTEVKCANGKVITVVANPDGTHSVTMTGTRVYDTTFRAERIPADQTTAEAAAQYAGQLANENGGPVQPRIARHRDAKHATITLTPCEGPEQRWLVATCYAGSRNIAKDGDRDITFSAPNLDRALAMGTALASVFNTITIAAAFDVLPAIKSLFGLAA